MTTTTAPLTDAQLDHLDQIEVTENETHEGRPVAQTVCHACQTTLPSDSHHHREQHARRATRRAA